MMREGVGRVAPSPVSVCLSGADMRACQEHAALRDTFRGYQRRADAWGRGLVKNPILIGLVGEVALCAFLSSRGIPAAPDILLRPKGDRGTDVSIGRLAMQVKTRRRGVSGINLIRRGDQYGRIVPLSCDLYVFAQWDEQRARVAPLLLGWIWSTRARNIGSFGRSVIQQSGHWNLKISDRDLLPMSRLVDELRAREDVA